MHHITDEAERYPIGRYLAPTSYTPEDRQKWIEELRALPSWLDVIIENLDAAQLETAYREGGWTVQQVIHHIADSHLNAYIRIRLILTEDRPTVKPYDENAWALLPDVATVPVNISITMLHTLHRRLVALLERVPDAAWDRVYFHPEHQRDFPLWEVVALYAWHGKHHMEQIRALRERMGWF